MFKRLTATHLLIFLFLLNTLLGVYEKKHPSLKLDVVIAVVQTTRGYVTRRRNVKQA
jgi:hypothetical protein